MRQTLDSRVFTVLWAKWDQCDRRGTMMSCGRDQFASWGKSWKLDLERPGEFSEVELWDAGNTIPSRGNCTGKVVELGN